MYLAVEIFLLLQEALPEFCLANCQKMYLDSQQCYELSVNDEVMRLSSFVFHLCYSRTQLQYRNGY